MVVIRSRTSVASFRVQAGFFTRLPVRRSLPISSDIIELDPAGVDSYGSVLVVTPWVEIGFTKTGINITRNNAEEDFDVDQVSGSIRRRPTNWEMSVGTQLAEATLETFQLAWELGPIAPVTPGTPQLAERHLGLGAPTAYRERLIAVLFQFPPEPSGAAPGHGGADQGVGLPTLLPRGAGVGHDAPEDRRAGFAAGALERAG